MYTLYLNDLPKSASAVIMRYGIKKEYSIPQHISGEITCVATDNIMMFDNVTRVYNVIKKFDL